MRKHFSRPVLSIAVLAALSSMSALSIPEALQGDDDGTFTKEQLDAAIANAVSAATAEAERKREEAISGLTAKNRELLGSLDEVKGKLKTFDGVDVKGLLDLKGKIEGDEILKLMAEGKHDVAIEKATERLRATHEADLTKITTELQTVRGESQRDKNLIDKLLIEGGAKAALVNAKGFPEAQEDAALLARSVWKVEFDAQGNPRLAARDADGELLKGENGALTIEEWAESLKKSRPHWFPASEGGNLKGAKGQKIDPNDIDAQIYAASKRSDVDEVRRLQNLKKEMKSGKKS